jgi:hypothetical protein
VAFVELAAASPERNVKSVLNRLAVSMDFHKSHSDGVQARTHVSGRIR